MEGITLVFTTVTCIFGILSIRIGMCTGNDPKNLNPGRCVMYDKCGSRPETLWLSLNCLDDNPPRSLDLESTDDLKLVCPELVTQHGNNLCCSAEQVNDLVTSFNVPESHIGRCPGCYHNYRQIVCETACSPYQFEFLNASGIIYNADNKPMITELTAYVSEDYVQKTYESCQNVMHGATNELVMEFLCGGSQNCTPHRWFDYMGSMENGCSPFDIIYKYVTTTGPVLTLEVLEKTQAPVQAFIPFTHKTFKCEDPIPNGTSGCSCVDCLEACLTPRKPEANHPHATTN